MLDIWWHHRWRDITPGVGWVHFFRWEPVPYLSWMCVPTLVAVRRSTWSCRKKGGTHRQTDRQTTHCLSTRWNTLSAKLWNMFKALVNMTIILFMLPLHHCCWQVACFSRTHYKCLIYNLMHKIIRTYFIWFEHCAWELKHGQSSIQFWKLHFGDNFLPCEY